ncbi:MAG TPA: tetratricopeptide repeat protein, partial [Terriglobales bacterium]|nr:tetratricopeptide repeat protein [Terriglobales bacterium]
MASWIVVISLLLSAAAGLSATEHRSTPGTIIKSEKYEGEAGQLLKRARAGDVDAEFQLGMALEHGNGVTRNYTRAREWYQKAAEAGDPPAQNNLGALLAKGLGGATDATGAVRWYLRAAVSGLAAAQNNLAYMYSTGQGT